MNTHDDDRMRRTLRELPRASASADFTAQVMARLDAEGRRTQPRPAPLLRRWAWAAGVVAALGVAAAGVWRIERVRADAADRAELASLRLEQASIARDLKQLRSFTSATSPVLYLGGDDQVDLVFDLRRAASRGPVIQPAAFPQRPGR